ncbi:MAG: hypothetical protein HZB51_30220 [Chloroflexi bacterium]|nr:hypothetical protein [Chloroflexota bacterium]
MAASHSQQFLVTPLETPLPTVPEGAVVVTAESIETLQNAQAVLQAASQFANRKIGFTEFKRRLRTQVKE